MTKILDNYNVTRSILKSITEASTSRSINLKEILDKEGKITREEHPEVFKAFEENTRKLYSARVRFKGIHMFGSKINYGVNLMSTDVFYRGTDFGGENVVELTSEWNTESSIADPESFNDYFHTVRIFKGYEDFIQEVFIDGNFNRAAAEYEFYPLYFGRELIVRNKLDPNKLANDLVSKMYEEFLNEIISKGKTLYSKAVLVLGEYNDHTNGPALIRLYNSDQAYLRYLKVGRRDVELRSLQDSIANYEIENPTMIDLNSSQAKSKIVEYYTDVYNKFYEKFGDSTEDSEEDNEEDVTIKATTSLAYVDPDDDQLDYVPSSLVSEVNKVVSNLKFDIPHTYSEIINTIKCTANEYNVSIKINCTYDPGIEEVTDIIESIVYNKLQRAVEDHNYSGWYSVELLGDLEVNGKTVWEI